MPHPAAIIPRSIRTVLAGRSGVALLMVLFVVVVLTSLVVSLTDTTQRHIHLTQYYKNRLQAFWTAQSGIQAAVALLQLDAQDPRGYDASNSCWNCESLCYQESAMVFLSVPLCGNSLIDPAITLAVDDPALETPQGRTRCPIVDENRKLSLFGLVKNPGQQNEETDDAVFFRLVYLLMYLVSEEDLRDPGAFEDPSASWLRPDPLGRTPIDYSRAQTLAGYVVDWIDTPANTSPTDLNPDRAETSCPEDGLPYLAKNGMMDSVDEIALVCGFRQMPRHAIEELGRNLTVYDLKTNINTATRPVLYAFCEPLEPGDGERCAAEIHGLLHPYEDELLLEPTVITSEGDYPGVLAQMGLTYSVIAGLRTATVFRSDHFRIGIKGLVINVGTGSVDAVAGVTMVVGRGAAGEAGGLRLYYYRED